MTDKETLRILTSSEVEELRATPGVTFPTGHVCTVTLSENDCVMEGITALSGPLTQPTVVDGHPLAILGWVIRECRRRDSRVCEVYVEGQGREALDELVRLGRIELVAERTP